MGIYVKMVYNMNMKQCVLQENKACSACGECNRCDLKPNKLCDNCCACIDQKGQPAEEMPGGYAQIPVADIVREDAEAYLREYYTEEEDYTSALPLYEKPDPELLAYWEERLRELEAAQAPALRGVRKKRER